jgi:hypothetical protein
LYACWISNETSTSPTKLKWKCTQDIKNETGERKSCAVGELTCSTDELLPLVVIDDPVLSVSSSLIVHCVTGLFTELFSGHSIPISAHALTCSNCVSSCDFSNLLEEIPNTCRIAIESNEKDKHLFRPGNYNIEL